MPTVKLETQVPGVTIEGDQLRIMAAIDQCEAAIDDLVSRYGEECRLPQSEMVEMYRRYFGDMLKEEG